MDAPDRAALLDALDCLSRRAEWGVRAFGPRGAMEWEAPRREIHDKLAAVAEEALLNPVQAVDPGGHPGEMFFSGVYLIADEEASDFRSAVRELAERFDRRGVDIVLGGPGPPMTSSRARSRRRVEGHPVRVVGGSPVLVVYAIVGKEPACLGLGVDGVPLRIVTGERLAAASASTDECRGSATTSSGRTRPWSRG